MDVEHSETVNYDLDELLGLLPKFLRGEVKNFQSFSNKVQDFNVEDAIRRTEEMWVFDLVEIDDKEQLVRQSNILFRNVDDKENKEPNISRSRHPNVSLRALHLCCKYDSVKCAKSLLEGEVGRGLNVNEIDESGRTVLHSAAEVHAERCIALLLSKQARTDVRSSDGNSQLPLESALYSQKMNIRWTAEDTVEDLLVSISETELSAVRMLVEKTNDIAEVAYANAMEGRVVALAVLLSIVPEKVTASITVLRPEGSSSSCKEATTVYECVIREALSLGQKDPSGRGGTRLTLSNSEKRKLLLCEIELLQLFDATVQERVCTGTERRAASYLIKASQVGDEEVVELLLKTNIEVNETDGEGNSALHWYLRTSSNCKKPRILYLLLKHGGAVRQRNRLGLTPLHVAAAQGHYQALQILLLKDLECIEAVSEMGETPLFFAVKNDFMNCVNLLLSHGASTQLFNLRKQRPIDLAKSQDMRFLLSQMSIRFWSGAEPITQEISPSYSSNDDQSDSDGQMLDIFANAQLDSSASERFSNTGSKRQLCRFFESLGGCSRGTTCYYAHGEEELLFSSPSSGNDKHQLGYEHMMKQGTPTFHSPNTEELKRKIFIGGLPPSVDSGTLKELFEHQFGSVEEATVIGNQSGKHVVSRGFGFVTFKSQESVIAAVNAHYVMISGKKVEIKGAIPKPKSPSEPAQPKSRQLEYHVLSPSGPRQRSGKLEPLTWLDTLLCSTTRDFKIENSFDSTSSDGIQNLLPQWVNTFRKWLPGFLQEVSKRLKEGELYPLSSLKGDFRATCGLELDHASLGYVKLSDFVRSFPGICRMKVVPVGRHGAATHMVLLPNLPSSPHHNRRHQLTPITSTDYSSNNSNLALLDENNSDDDDDDDDDDTRLIEDLMLDVNSRCATIQHYYQGTSGSSGHEGVKKEGTNMQGDQGAGFQRFLEAIRPTEDGQWPPWPGGSSGSGGSGGEDTNRHVVLEALSNESKDFSYFHCQYDFHERYRKRLEKQRCFRCNINRMLWYSYPCNHKLWCEPCRKWVDTQIREALRGGCKRSDIKCVYCNRVMERHGFHVWGNKLNNEQPDNEQQPNNQQQPMGDGEGEGEGSQLNNEQQPVVANQQPNINLNNQLDFPPLG